MSPPRRRTPLQAIRPGGNLDRFGAVTLVVLAALNAGDTWGFGKPWARGRVVQVNPFLR